MKYLDKITQAVLGNDAEMLKVTFVQTQFMYLKTDNNSKQSLLWAQVLKQIQLDRWI